jgi:hypothetical protein
MRALLLAAATCAASLSGVSSAAAEAPWTLARGSLVVDEIPTGNAWQTRSYLLSDTASGKAAVRALNVFRLSPYAEPCAQLVDCGGNASGAFATAARHGVTIVALLQTHAVCRPPLDPHARQADAPYTRSTLTTCWAWRTRAPQRLTHRCTCTLTTQRYTARTACLCRRPCSLQQRAPSRSQRASPQRRAWET